VWIDENGVTHTAWVPPEVILGEQAVAALRAVSRELADAAIADLDAAAMSLYDEASAGAIPGPSDLESVDLSEIEYPPEFPGLEPQSGEALSQTILRYLSEVPAQWRVEAMEAVLDILEPSDGPTGR
jgi:hypothetical protein